MKTVAVALVFIAGAAVVLWYGNTLNSLVLGGLIGGLAALLISIPISVTLFSYLSRRHDERLRAELQEQEEFSHAQGHGYQDGPVYVIDSGSEEEERDGMVFPEEDGWQEEIAYRQNSPQYYLPAPADPRPAQRASHKLPAETRSRYVTPPSPSAKKQPARGKSQSTQRPTQQRGLSTGFPGYQASNFRSQALRTARQEAARQNDEDRDEIATTYVPRRIPPVRPVRQSLEQEQDEYIEQDVYPRSTRPTPQSPTKHYQQQPRRNYEGSTSPNSPQRSSTREDASAAHQSRRFGTPRTDELDPDVLSNTLNRPLQRRAPYMYEDDKMREEFSQHVDVPITRRSSRKLVRRPDEE